MTVGAAPARADASNPPQDPQVAFFGQKVDGYVGLISNYYSVLQGLLTTADWVNNLVSPQPSLADLLQQMETQIIAAIKSERDDGLTWAAQGWTQRFQEIISDPQNPLNVAPSQSVEDLLNDAAPVWTSMANIIAGTSGDDFSQAYRMAVPFVTLRALYMAMLQYEGYPQDVIDARIQSAIQTEYQLIGTTDADCAISSGVNTEFDSRVFAAKYLALRAFDYTCSVDTCQFDAGPARGDDYGCSQVRLSQSSPVSVNCIPGFEPDLTCSGCANQSVWCQNFDSRQQACVTEATNYYRWKFHHDFVTAIVRADLSLMLQQLQQHAENANPVSAPLYCGQPIGLLPFGELCSGQSCAVDVPPGIASQSSNGSALGVSSDPAFLASWALDGTTAPSDGTQVSLTNVETNPWWQEDLGFYVPLSQILIWPSDLSKSNAEPFVQNIVVQLNNEPDGTALVNNYFVNNINQLTAPIVVNTNGYGARYIRIKGLGTGALSLAEVQVVLDEQQPTMAFESAAAWQVQNGGSASLSATAFEGAHSLAVTAAPGGWTPIVSQPLSSMQIRSVAKSTNLSAMSFALNIPTSQANASWAGAAQLYISSPSANVTNAYMGQVDLTPLAKGSFVRLAYAIPSYAMPAVTLDHSDVTFTIVLNVNGGTSGWLIDDLEVGR